MISDMAGSNDLVKPIASTSRASSGATMNVDGGSDTNGQANGTYSLNTLQRVGMFVLNNHLQC